MVARERGYAASCILTSEIFFLLGHRVNSVLRAYLLNGVKWKTGYKAVLQVAAHTTTYKEGAVGAPFVHDEQVEYERLGRWSSSASQTASARLAIATS